MLSYVYIINYARKVYYNRGVRKSILRFYNIAV